MPLRFSLLALLLAGCANPPASSPRTVRVAAAANLKFAFEEIAAAFRAAHPDVLVSLTYGASGTLAAQIANGGPFDLFLSADMEYPKQVADRGLAAGPVFPYATGRLVVWVPNASPLDVEAGVKVAADPRVRTISLANPRHAPYGRAAVAALEHAGLTDAMGDRLVFGENVEQAAQFVRGGAAEVGFLPLSLAISPVLRDAGRYAVVPAASHPPVEQGGVVLTGAADPAAAEALRDFLLGPAGREVLRRHGYGAPAS